MLAMMVDLEDDPDWSVSDDLDDEDNDRYFQFSWKSRSFVKEECPIYVLECTIL